MASKRVQEAKQRRVRNLIGMSCSVVEQLCQLIDEAERCRSIIGDELPDELLSEVRKRLPAVIQRIGGKSASEEVQS